jgi:hypothetical protein
MITQPKIMILSLLCAAFVNKHFYGIFREDFLHTKVLEADLKLSF